MTNPDTAPRRSQNLHMNIFANLKVHHIPILSLLIPHRILSQIRLVDYFDYVLMPSQYKLYPSMNQTNISYHRSPELDEALSRHPRTSLQARSTELEYSCDGRIDSAPASNSTSSHIEFDIDISEFMDMSTPFPWEGRQSALLCNDLLHRVRNSFESSSSTVQCTYSTMDSPLSNDKKRFAWPQNSRESVLIPEFPRDLAYHHVQACGPRPANLRTSSGECRKPSQPTNGIIPSSKRSLTAWTVESFAGALEPKCSRPIHTPQRSFESSYTQERAVTPSLSFSSTTASSPASSITSPLSGLAVPSVDVITNKSSSTELRTENAKSRANAHSSDRGLIGSKPKHIPRKISGPIPSAEYPSMMNLTISAISTQIYSSDEAFQPSRKTPKPPSPLAAPPNLGTYVTHGEPPSWFDLDDDVNGHSVSQRILPIKLSIPHLGRGADSSCRKNTPIIPSSTHQHHSKDSNSATTNAVWTKDSGKFYTANESLTAHVSLLSSTPTSTQTKGAGTISKKRSSAHTKSLTSALSFSTRTSKKNSKKVKFGSSSKNKPTLQPPRFSAWVGRVFG